MLQQVGGGLAPVIAAAGRGAAGGGGGGAGPVGGWMDGWVGISGEGEERKEGRRVVRVSPLSVRADTRTD